jgi:RNA polymerase sigma-70 factor (ECF subfamily)
VERFDISELYRREAEAVLVFFARRTYDAEVAVDLMAETFARAHESRQHLRGEDVTAWLWGIARNVLRDAHRRGSRERRALRRLAYERVVLSDDEIERIEELAGLDDLRGVVAAALEGLPADQQRALQLRVVQQLDYADVASRLGVSEVAVRARVSRALRALAVAVDVIERPA